MHLQNHNDGDRKLRSPFCWKYLVKSPQQIVIRLSLEQSWISGESWERDRRAPIHNDCEGIEWFNFL